MNVAYGRDLDLNLLRVLVVVVEEGSVTKAASRLYVTQPAISAALGRLRRAVGEPLFVRQGRLLAPTARGRRIFEEAQPSLRALTESVTHSAPFVPATSERVFRLGLSDDAQIWLLPRLLVRFAAAAPRMKLVVLPVTFRTVAAGLSEHGLDLALTVADDLPASVSRQELHTARFVCLYDPVHSKLPARPSLKRYLAQPHVVVSYNGDLRGYVEDSLGIERRVVCSVTGFAGIGAIVRGTPLLATVPETVARCMEDMFPGLRHAPLPFTLPSYPVELLWRRSLDHDPAHMWLREQLRAAAKEAL